MLSRFNKNILTGILVLLLLNTYVFESEPLNVLIGIAVLGIFIYSNRKVLKTLSLLEIIGMVVFIAAVIGLLVGFFFFIASPLIDRITVGRSEEHTSELQSRGHLVCRLLLEKKKPRLHRLY